jgi:5'-nucleotidase
MTTLRDAVLAALAAAPALVAAASPSGVRVAPAAGAAASAPLCGQGPLEILLTNDDGYAAPGIRALYVQLRAAGHHVRLVAPIANASGSSASFTWTNVTLQRDPSDPNVAGVGASPATAVVLGARALYPPGERPDLIVSGINDGSNAGSLLVLSGTIGAALAGTLLLDPPVPGFAVNAERARTAAGAPTLPANHASQVAAHFSRLLEVTRGWFCVRGRLAYPDLVLNVNYPARPVADVAGTTVAHQGHSSDFSVGFEPAADGTYLAKVSEPLGVGGAPGTDVELLEHGYVTVTPLQAGLERRDVRGRELRRRLKTLDR